MQNNNTTKQIERACQFCGKSFTSFLSNVIRGNGKFCSFGCGVKSRTKPLSERFWKKVLKTENCWIWQGRLNPSGYGLIDRSGSKKRGGRPLLAHRVSWEIANGEIIDNLFVCHSCDVPNCVNPAHLFLGTNQDNVDDMVSKSRQKRGEASPNTRLTNEIVRQIRQDFTMGKPQTEIAADLNVNKITVFDIVHRKTWKHIK